MKLFKFIRDSLANIGFKSSYQPKHDSVGVAPEATVKESEDKIVRQRVREAFAAQEKEIRLRSAKPHSFACEDNWTCKKNPCYVVEPDVIVVPSLIPTRRIKSIKSSYAAHSPACEEYGNCGNSECLNVEPDVIVRQDIIPTKRRGPKPRAKTVQDKDFER